MEEPKNARLVEIVITRRYRVEGETLIPTVETRANSYEKQPEQPQKSEGMSEAGRKAISEAQKRRWAEYHAKKREMITRKDHSRAQHIRASPVKQIDWKAILGVSLKDFVSGRYAKNWEFNEIIEDAKTKIVRADTTKDTANDLMARFTISARVEYSNALKNPKPQTLHQKAAIEYWNSPASIEHRKKLRSGWTKDSPRARRTKFYQILGKTITQFAQEGIEAQTPYPTLLENGKQLIMKTTPDAGEYKRLADAFSSSLRHAYGIMTWKKMQQEEKS